MEEQPRSIGALLVGNHLTTLIKMWQLAVSDVPLFLFWSVREIALVLRHGRIVRNFKIVNLMQGWWKGSLSLCFHFSAHCEMPLGQLFLDGREVLTFEHASVGERPIGHEIFDLAVHLPTEKFDA